MSLPKWEVRNKQKFLAFVLYLELIPTKEGKRMEAAQEVNLLSPMKDVKRQTVWRRGMEGNQMGNHEASLPIGVDLKKSKTCVPS